MAKNKMKISNWIFLLGALISALVGIASALSMSIATNKWIAPILVILGLVVGFMNVKTKETVPFLLSAIVLLAFGAGGLSTLDTVIPKLGTLLGTAVQAFSWVIGSAAIVVAFKEAWMLASKE